ncbi:MAG: DUF4954 family protein [Phycisphaerae bacterium]|nr:DUF4954 family protein [Phycisphaerae bacterium]
MSQIHCDLTELQIDQLIVAGCQCPDWGRIKVTQNFKPDRIKNTSFSGDVKIGNFDGPVSFYGGVTKPSGITNATIHNCIIGDNVYIDQIGSYIANYIIEDDVVIENVDLLAVQPGTTFANGIELLVLNEAGGREIPMYDRLSAQTAYLLALYRHRPELIEKIKSMIGDYTKSVTSSMGTIGKETRIINCRVIKNVRTGPNTTIEGVNKLENGSVNSTPEGAVYIGPGVSAEDFIICSGSKISDGTLLSHCFIGQGCELSKQYSAENSAFFANCGGFHGEACSIFAGPYTVTHHKSTLLIAGLFSFLNAGSGSNQSNHMYKLGPVHQGVVERGSKTTSDSYILWPAKVGPFTVVMGRHYRRSDTSGLPFSYLIEHEDESVLIPGVNLRSVGTVRDARKWPKRDKRKDPVKFDRINFKLLSPFTVQKMINGIRILESLKETSGEMSDYYTYHSVKIKNTSLDNGIKLYNLGITKFIGNCLLKRLEGKNFENPDQLRQQLKSNTEIGKGKWLDLAGMFAPQQVINDLLDDVESGKISTLERLDNEFDKIHDSYSEYEWVWATRVIEERINKKIEQMTAEDIIELTCEWGKAVIKLDNILYSDARKEFLPSAQIGFGIDGEQDIRQQDFEAVRGSFEENSFVSEIQKHIEAKTKLADDLLERLKKLC